MNDKQMAVHIKSLMLDLLLSRRLAGAVKARLVAFNLAKKCQDKTAKNVLIRFSNMTIREFNASAAMLERKMLS